MVIDFSSDECDDEFHGHKFDNPILNTRAFESNHYPGLLDITRFRYSWQSADEFIYCGFV